METGDPEKMYAMQMHLNHQHYNDVCVYVNILTNPGYAACQTCFPVLF